MQIGDVAQIKLEGHWGDVDVCLNVFHALNLEAGTEIIDIINLFVGGLITELRALYYSTTFVDAMTGVNLFDPSEAAELYLGLVGSRAGMAEALPSQTAVCTRYFHDNPGIRSAYKRWWNPYEADQSNGVMSAGIVGAYELCSWAPILDLLPTAVYVVVKRIREGVPGNYTYRLPENVGELDYGAVSDFDLNTRLSSQNSRKCLPI